ncbi:hypothetical protein LBMAG42_42650 [Deltaproteobacteria bacterium]|nr:hypothetical protein LBMAG42_42650 [Deltaproteobacteria bacterium]
MSLVLALASFAFADRVYWVSPPAPADVDAASRTLPGASAAPLDALVAEAPDASQGKALDTLRAELEAVRPLLTEFDGELQIMARLRKATADVTELRTPEDADLLWQALCVEGNAVHRYFGDRLDSEPGAAPYRTQLGPIVVVGPWVDAVALKGAANPNDADVPEKPQRLGYDGVRAIISAMPAASFEIGRLAEGAVVYLDGRRVDASPGSRTLIVPGRHFFSIKVGDVGLLHGDAELREATTMRAEAPFGPKERDALVALAAKPAGWSVPEAALVPIRGANEPVYLGTPGNGRPKLVRVDRGTAEAVEIVAPAVTYSPISVHAALGAGWMSTGDFFLLNVDDGAPYSGESVNAFSPALSADVQWRTGLFAVSGGVSGQVATGDYHSLPSGDTEVRTVVYPHVGVGLPWVQATVGPMFPWYLGLGLKARVPVASGFEVAAGGVYGMGMSVEREAGAPDYEPLPLYSAWAGVGWAFN